MIDFLSERCFVLSFTFPNNKDTPASLLKLQTVRGIPPLITLQLREPICLISFRLARPDWAIVPMPKTAMNEDGHLSAYEGKVGLSRKVLAVQAIT
jgi:hypothetical protein